MEVWMDVVGYEGRYQVSDDGRVKSMSRTVRARYHERVVPEKIMSVQYHWRGYPVVWLRKPGVHKKFFVHRLVAMAFIPNPGNKEIVNHIDHDKKNCVVTNLEWCTLSENSQAAARFYAGKNDNDEPF